MSDSYRKRRFTVAILMLLVSLFFIITNNPIQDVIVETPQNSGNFSETRAIEALSSLKIKGRAPKTGYDRNQFGSDWSQINGCSMRDTILNRDLNDAVVDDQCNVTAGVLNDPYSGKTVKFFRGTGSAAVQIDHVVALSDAWQKGAQNLTRSERINLANDPLELLAVDGKINMQKGDGDAATWLPPNKTFRCQYIARQVAVKIKYKLWVTAAEHSAMENILSKCPDTMLPSP